MAKRWIEKGYNATTVLNSVGLATSTYYYNITKESKGEQTSTKKQTGRKIPGYSLNKKGEKIPDELIKEYLCELIALCKELDILRPQRKIYPKRPKKLAKREKITGPNQLWQMDLKYGYIAGTSQFFFQLSAIDVFDRSIVGYHVGLSATAKDACRVLINALKKRNLTPGMKMPVIRTDNGPQFIAKLFKETCDRWNIKHERIPVKTPNMNAYIESFHSILEDECYSRHEFDSFMEVYGAISEYIDYYNNRRRHSSIKYMAPNEFYKAFTKGQLANSVQPLIA
ncbi:DDE-type integrase/transposase/recombinase [Bacillota bacterium LX-D]|nr:DDE-type integrase/transposase/recombinase [Bacillota bacterium LX-D]